MKETDSISVANCDVRVNFLKYSMILKVTPHMAGLRLDAKSYFRRY
jgi:hypothetical protein